MRRRASATVSPANSARSPKRNSCEGPWTATAAASIVAQPAEARLGQPHEHLAQHLEPVRRHRRAGARRVAHAGMGTAGDARSDAAPRARLRPDDRVVHLRREPAVRRHALSRSSRAPAVHRQPRGERAPDGDQDHQGVDQIVGAGRSRRATKRSGPAAPRAARQHGVQSAAAASCR